MISGEACPGSRWTGAKPMCWRSVSGVKTAPQEAHEKSSALTGTWQLWHMPSRLAIPGVREAKFQYWRVLGPRMIVSFVTLPRLIRSRSVSNEQPGRKGAAGSRMNQGPIAFCVACRDRGSKKPPQRSHRLGSDAETLPQYGQRIPLWIGWG